MTIRPRRLRRAAVAGLVAIATTPLALAGPSAAGADGHESIGPSPCQAPIDDESPTKNIIQCAALPGDPNS